MTHTVFGKIPTWLGSKFKGRAAIVAGLVPGLADTGLCRSPPCSWLTAELKPVPFQSDCKDSAP